LIVKVDINSIESELKSLDLLTLPGPTGYWTWQLVISFALMNTFGGLMWPQTFTRLYMNKNLNGIKTQATWLPIAAVLVMVLSTSVGAMAHTILPEVDNTDQIMPLIAMKLFNPYIVAVVAIGIVSALMSTASSQL